MKKTKKPVPVQGLNEEQQKRLRFELENQNHHDIVDFLFGTNRKPPKKKGNNTIQAVFATAIFIMLLWAFLIVNQ